MLSTPLVSKVTPELVWVPLMVVTEILAIRLESISKRVRKPSAKFAPAVRVVLEKAAAKKDPPPPPSPFTPPPPPPL
jgi:hypothetical protein